MVTVLLLLPLEITMLDPPLADPAQVVVPFHVPMNFAPSLLSVLVHEENINDVNENTTIMAITILLLSVVSSFIIYDFVWLGYKVVITFSYFLMFNQLFLIIVASATNQ